MTFPVVELGADPLAIKEYTEQLTTCREQGWPLLTLTRDTTGQSESQTLTVNYEPVIYRRFVARFGKYVWRWYRPEFGYQAGPGYQALVDRMLGAFFGYFGWEDALIEVGYQTAPIFRARFLAVGAREIKEVMSYARMAVELYLPEVVASIDGYLEELATYGYPPSTHSLQQLSNLRAEAEEADRRVFRRFTGEE